MDCPGTLRWVGVVALEDPGLLGAGSWLCRLQSAIAVGASRRVVLRCDRAPPGGAGRKLALGAKLRGSLPLEVGDQQVHKA